MPYAAFTATAPADPAALLPPLPASNKLRGNLNLANTRADNRHRLTLLRVSPVEIALDRYQAHLPPAPSANRPTQRAPRPGPTVPFKPFRTDPLNREPTAEPGSTAPFKPFRTDPVNREPGTFPDPDPHSVHRLHETPHVREPWRCAAHAEPAPQARNFCRG
jgi:hypothetical protein